jgi:hypothetical protein
VALRPPRAPDPRGREQGDDPADADPPQSRHSVWSSIGL